MKLQLLVATMHQTDRSLPQKMNIQCDAIIGNQCDRNGIEQTEWQGHRITWLDFAERGLSRNRDNALLRADADICLLADDDLVYDDGYVDSVCRAFEEHPDADMIVFDIRNHHMKHRISQKTVRVSWLNCLRWGSVRMAFRLDSVREHGIFFNLNFGAGTPRGYGEDTLFLTSFLHHGLKVYAVPTVIASLTDERQSTWFRGFDENYLRTKGPLFRAISPRFGWLLCLQDAVRHHRKYGMSWHQAYRLMRRAGKEK